MKKFSLLIFAVLALVLSSCGGSTPENQEVDEQDTLQTEILDAELEGEDEQAYVEEEYEEEEPRESLTAHSVLDTLLGRDACLENDKYKVTYFFNGDFAESMTVLNKQSGQSFDIDYNDDSEYIGIFKPLHIANDRLLYSLEGDGDSHFICVYDLVNKKPLSFVFCYISLFSRMGNAIRYIDCGAPLNEIPAGGKWIEKANNDQCPYFEYLLLDIATLDSKKTGTYGQYCLQ